MFQKLLTGFPLLIFFLVLGAVTWLLGHILKPFFFAIFWAILLAAIFDPVNEWLRRKVKNPNVSAGLALAAVILTLILPAGLILTLLVEQSLDLYQSMNQNGGSWMQNLTGFLQSVGSHPLLAARPYGKGKSLVWTSDIGPHWCPEPFVTWEGYGKLWLQTLTWLAG